MGVHLKFRVASSVTYSPVVMSPNTATPELRSDGET